ncbi:ADP-ribose pyrophosphatase YjhB (NUDIX family) [Isoptericola jiangsuensis]|uniref:ADP-ribose pyrophosphatase YjhB (NUDIX family) n=1 Tax=Isoptericola jiangsuensis TaxID=548579 RepID=A0A2A9EZX1_9MICO|nr:NUDIX domain-containing protein [Isoptericola jiangsuensis]PFG43852.1 ADP-ribose pyrophosphatase YjhB (NUDIX family) [Isoptericola jiangsuensis]
MRLRVAAYAVVIDDGQVLLPHWRQSGYGSGWTLPGGGIDPGEHPADAAVREVWEETGYDVELDDLLGIDSIVLPPAGDLSDGAHGLRIVYRAHVVGGSLRAEVGGSTDDVAWHRLEEVAALDRAELVDAGLAMAGVTLRRP